MRTRPTLRNRRRYRVASTRWGNANTSPPGSSRTAGALGQRAAVAPPTSAHNRRACSHAPLRSPRPALAALRGLAPLRGCPALLARPRRRRRAAPQSVPRAAALRALPLPRPAHDTTQHNDAATTPGQTRAAVVPIRAGKECAPARRVRQVWPVTSLAFSRPDTAAQPLRYTTSAEAAPLAM